METKKTHYLNQLLKHLQMTGGQLSKLLGYDSPNRIYYVLRFRNGISTDLAKDICKKYPEVNYDWLMTGEGDMLIKQEEKHVETISIDDKDRIIKNLLELLDIKTLQLERYKNIFDKKK